MMATATTTATTTCRRPKAKGILSLLLSGDSKTNNKNSSISKSGGDEEHSEFITFYPYHEATLRQTDQLLRRHRTNKKLPTNDATTTNHDNILSPTTTTPIQPVQRNLDDVLASVDIVLLFFAEARGWAHSIRVRPMVSRFCHDDDDDEGKSIIISDDGCNDDDPNDSSHVTTTPSCCCVCILNGPPDEDADWKRTFLEGTGFYAWPTTTTAASTRSPNDDIDMNAVDHESLLQLHEPSPPPPDGRRAAIIQLLSIIQVPTLVVMDTRTGRPVTHDGLAIIERQWWYLSKNVNPSLSNNIDDEYDDDNNETGQTTKHNEAGGGETPNSLEPKSVQARKSLLEEWKCGRSGWTTTPWVVHNVTSCTTL